MIIEDYNCETYFPLSLAGEVINILRDAGCTFARPSDFKVPRTVAQLDRLSYLAEYFWFKGRGLPPLSRTAHIFGNILRQHCHRKNPSWHATDTVALLLHDADHQPHKTIDMLRYEAALGVVSSAFFLYEQNLGPQYERYKVNVSALQDFERQGFEIGYHMNAYELSGYDLERAEILLDRDLNWFGANFNLKSFSPHGGVPGPNGENNHLYPYRGRLRNLLWAYNGHRLLTDNTWSDGNIGFEEVEDPRELARRVKPGDRVSFLMHPQYYGDKLSPNYVNLPIARQQWWRDLWRLDRGSSHRGQLETATSVSQ